MINYHVTPGTANVSVTIRIIDSTDGTPETGVTAATGGLALEYRREGAASTAITESDLALLTTAHTDGGMLHIGNGYYRLDVPDAAFAAGVPGCLIHGTATGMVVIGCYVHLENAVDAVYDRIGAPVAASISADIAVVDGNVDSILVDTAEIGVAGAGLTAINLPDQTMNITGNITGNLSGSVGSVTGAVGSISGVTFPTNFADLSITVTTGRVDVASVTGTAQTAGDIPALITALNDVSAADVNAQCDTAISDAALATAANLATVDTVVDAIKVVTDALGSTAAAQLAASMLGVVTGAFEGTPTTSSMQTDLAETTDSHYNGSVLVITSGVGAGQRTDITGYTGATGTLAVTAVTTAPAAADTFIIV